MLNQGFGNGGAPILEEIEVRGNSGRFTIGIEYQGTDTFSEIHRSKIVVLGGTTQSAGIEITTGRLNRVRDTVIETYFGASASGIHVRSAFTNPPQDLWLMNTTIISASSTQSNYGIKCADAFTLNVMGSQIVVHHNSQAFGIRQTTGPTAVLNSYILASTAVVSSIWGVNISNSQLVGGPVTAGWKACLGVSDEAGAFYTGPCPP
jgi:hypothetical protein